MVKIMSMCFRQEFEVISQVLVLPLRLGPILLLALYLIKRIILLLPLLFLIKLRINACLIVFPAIVQNLPFLVTEQLRGFLKNLLPRSLIVMLWDLVPCFCDIFLAVFRELNLIPLDLLISFICNFVARKENPLLVRLSFPRAIVSDYFTDPPFADEFVNVVNNPRVAHSELLIL